jgi:hypothetical protein
MTTVTWLCYFTVWLLNVLVEHVTLTLGIKEMSMEAVSPNGMRPQTVERHISEDRSVQIICDY